MESDTTGKYRANKVHVNRVLGGGGSADFNYLLGVTVKRNFHIRPQQAGKSSRIEILPRDRVAPKKGWLNLLLLTSLGKV